MAHFAELDSKNQVLRVVVIADAECLNSNGLESEDVGISFCQQVFGKDTKWKQTSYNSKIRTKFAGIGFTYSNELDAFIPPQPYPSWNLNQETCNWVPPIPSPDDGQLYNWNESQQVWELVPIPITDNTV